MDKMDTSLLPDLITNHTNYKEFNHKNIITLKTNNLNVILFDVPIKL